MSKNTMTILDAFSNPKPPKPVGEKTVPLSEILKRIEEANITEREDYDVEDMIYPTSVCYSCGIDLEFCDDVVEYEGFDYCKKCYTELNRGEDNEGNR